MYEKTINLCFFFVLCQNAERPNDFWMCNFNQQTQVKQEQINVMPPDFEARSNPRFWNNICNYRIVGNIPLFDDMCYRGCVWKMTQKWQEMFVEI